MGDAVDPAVSAAPLGNDGNPPALLAADSAADSAGPTAAAGDAPNGVIGWGVAAIAPISVFNVLEYVTPTPVFCPQYSVYSPSSSAILGLSAPKTHGLILISAVHSLRLATQTADGITDDLAIVLASTAACPMDTCLRQCAIIGASPAKFSSLPFSAEATPPRPIHCDMVAAMLAMDAPIDSSWLTRSEEHAAILATTVDGSLDSRSAATLSGGPNHKGSGILPR